MPANINAGALQNNHGPVIRKRNTCLIDKCNVACGFTLGHEITGIGDHANT